MRRALGWAVRILGRSGRTDADIDEEIQSHLELHIHDNIRAGMTPGDARRQAWIALGGVERTRDLYRDQRGFPMLDALLRDVRHAARRLAATPGFSIAAILILGLGIGANAAIFSVVDAVLLKPLPFREPSRLVRVWHTPPREQFGGIRRFSVSPANYLDWQAQSQAFEHMAIYGYGTANLTGQGEPDALAGVRVSGDFFPILQPAPLLGRLLDRNDTEPGHSEVVVLSEHVWKTRFGGDRSVVGRTTLLNGERYTIVGVNSDAARFPGWADVWLPLVWTPEERAVRGNHNYLVIARLAPGADLGRAQAELTTISERLERLYPADDKGWGAVAVPLQQDVVADVRAGLLVLLGAVACVLLIACANIANLLLARVLGRARDIAIRTAVGASRSRIVQQLLVESALLGIAGGAAGIVAAYWAVDVIVKAFGTSLPRASGVAVNGTVLAFTALVAVATGLLAGIAPAWRMTRGDAAGTLKDGMGRGGSSTGERRVRNALVTAEVALALMLLVASGVLIRTLSHLHGVDAGIDPSNVVTMSVIMPQTRYATPERRGHFFADLLARTRAIPGVRSAAAIDSLPLQDGGSMQPIAVQGETPRPLSEQPEVPVRQITPEYLETMGMRLVAGREFSDGDVPGRPLVVEVSAATARRFWPDRDPIGQHVTLGLVSDEPREVVGVVSNVRLLGLSNGAQDAVYVPYAQVSSPGMSLAVRTTLPIQNVTTAIVAAIHAVDPEQPVTDILTMDEVMGESIAQQRFAMRLLTAFAGLALVLAAIGIYGVLSYSVRQRAREIGIRMALGAARPEVVRLVVLEALKPTAAGLVIGVVGAAALGHLLSSLVFGVTPRDPLTIATVAGLVFAVGVAATILPAWRATRVNPIEALRAE